MALVTPSYGADYDCCRLLVCTAARALPVTVHHYIIVERRELEQFATLAGPRTSILVAEELLPEWMRSSGDADWSWMSEHSGPFTGWMAQQLLKLSVFDAITEDVAVFCDSDNAFFRPFDPHEALVLDGRVGLLRVPFASDQQRRWGRISAELLGTDAAEVPDVTYVGNVIAWRREVVVGLHRRLAEVSGTDWQEAFVRRVALSEYSLYGTYVDQVLGLEASGHFVFTKELMLPSWGTPILTREDAVRFVKRVRPDHVGLMVHSKDRAQVDWYSGYVLDVLASSTGPSDDPRDRLAWT